VQLTRDYAQYFYVDVDQSDMLDCKWPLNFNIMGIVGDKKMELQIYLSTKDQEPGPKRSETEFSGKVRQF
jgi:hypothetical protein